MKRNFVLVVLMVVIMAVLGRTAAAKSSESKSYLVIATRQNVSVDTLRSISRAGGTVEKLIPHVGIAVVNASDEAFSAKATRIRGVRSVVPNLSLQWINPSEEEVALEDYGYPPASGDDDFLFDLQWGHNAVGAQEAWAAGYRGAGVRVAVLDEGFDLTHPDLAPNINFELSKSFVPGEGLQYELTDTFSHGSHTAGTVAAADNGVGTIGIAPDAELILVKVLSENLGYGDFDWIIEGIVYAADNDADIISMSIGGLLVKSGEQDLLKDPYTAREAAELKNAVARATTYAYQQGATVIASSGNGGIDMDHSADLIHLPSDTPHTLSISATGPWGWGVDQTTDLDVPAYYTNHGQSAISFAAPGGTVDWDNFDPGEMCTVAGLTRPCYVFDFVFSVGNDGWYWSIGTSMAAPHVSGVAAIIIGANGGEMHPSKVKAALMASADDLGKPGIDDWYGRGRVNAGNYFE